MAVDTSTVQVVMPAMGDSVAEGTVLEWHKQEGDHVSDGETIVEISTDKVDAEVPAPVTGKLLRRHVAEGDTVAVGALLAEIAPGSPQTNGGGQAAAPAEPAAGGQAAAPAEPAAARIVDVVTPGGGESVTEGTILEWSVKVGDRVSDGDTIVEISTDKVDMELPAPASGTILEILAGDGETVTVGQVIARIAAEQASRAGSGAEPSPAPAAPQAAAAGSTATAGAGANASPV
ncbi:MAG: biotin/lipoyl-containing protein, partial [Solirubrobacteraceae bacterium]